MIKCGWLFLTTETWDIQYNRQSYIERREQLCNKHTYIYLNMKNRKQNTLRVVLTLVHKFVKRNIDLFVPVENKNKQLNNGEQYWPSGHV